MSVPPENPDEEIVEGWATAPVAGDRVDVHQGPIIAGDPDGARVEVTGDGLHAYDSTGRETAHIRGEGGEFVGGEFRTSDHLPGQVTISSTALQNPYSGISEPGIRVEPINSSGYARLPGVGPSNDSILISGGQGTNGSLTNVALSPVSAAMQWRQGDAWAFTSTSQDAVYSQARATNGDHGELQAAPTNTILRTTRADGGGGAMQTTQYSAMVFQEDSSGTVSRIYANENEAHLFTRAGGVNRYLTVDAHGIWVRTGGKSYNLEETAQDSGWQSIPLASGVSGAGSPAWRNKGGVIYFRGTVNATWTDGWNTVATGLPAEMRPNVRVVRTSPSTGGANLLFRMDGDGLLQFYRPGNGSVQGDLSGLFYPLG